MKSPPLFEKELSGDFYSTPPPPRWFFSVGGAYLFSWQAAGKIANFASHLIQGLFIRAYEPCFFRILSSLSLSNFRFNVGNFTTREIRGEGIAKKIRKFVKMVLKCIFVYDNRWMKRCYDLKYFFDILRKCERTRRGLYSKTSLTEKRVRKEGTWNFSRSFFPPLINDFFSTSLLRASSRNYYTKRGSVVKIRRKKDVEIEKRERERERGNSWWSRNDLICRKIIPRETSNINVIHGE